MKQALNDLKNGKYNSSFSVMYGDCNKAIERYSNALKGYEEFFGEANEVRFFSAPGRTEVGGNHTDHQHGCVLAGSVDLDVIAVVSPNNSGIVNIKSEGFPQDTIDLSDLSPNSAEYGKAIGLIRGMCGEFAKDGYNIGGFNAYTTSNVLKGSGLSSSAAFEVLVGSILSGLYNDNSVSPVEIAKIAQRSENIYFGKPCGLMDQMASAVGGFTAIDFADPTNPIIEKVEFDLESKNHKLVIVNSKGDHADLTQDYADITIECKQVSEFFGKSVLRDVSKKEFYEKMPSLREKVGDRAIVRAIHYFNENDRAIAEKEALKNGEFEKFLNIVVDSGNSSYKYLQNVFSTSKPKEQAVSVALALAESVLKGRGAHRVHGGGFAGTIQAFVPMDLLNEYLETMKSVFGDDSCYVLNIRPIGCTEVK